MPDRAPSTGDDESAFERVRLADVEIAYVDRGPTQAGASAEVPLLLLHGFTGHRDDWIGVLPRLSETRRVVTMDFRGHGDSTSPSDASAYSFEYLVKDVIGLLDHLEIQRVDLLGHSVGGMVAQRIAQRHPERVRSLVLMSTAPEMPAALPRSGMERAAEIAMAKGMSRFQELAEAAARAEADPVLDRWGDRYWRHHRRRVSSMTPESYRGIGLALYQAGSFAAYLSEITCPTLVLCGSEDREFRPGFEALEASLPKKTTRCRWIDGAGHHPHQEATEAWLREVEAHWSRL